MTTDRVREFHALCDADGELLDDDDELWTVPSAEQWTTRDVAAYLGVKESTVRAYHSPSSRSKMPKPDGQLGRTPWWKPETIRAWR